MAAGSEPTFFLGEYEHTLDTQRRVAIPAAWRGCSRFVLLPSRDHAIQMMSVDTFREMVLDKTRKLSLGNVEDARNLARLGSRAQECVCDKQGRIQIGQQLAAHAGLKDKVALVGSVSMILLYSPEAWSRMQQENGEDACYDVLEKLSRETAG